MQSSLYSTLVITVVVWSRFHVSIADEPTWSLRLSDTSRDGRFLNVPIYYGDWVPITRAKQTIEAVASKIEAASKLFRHSDPAPEIITADQPEDRLDSIVPYDPSQHHHYATQHTQQQHSHHTVSFVLESDVCNCTGGMGEIKLLMNESIYSSFSISSSNSSITGRCSLHSGLHTHSHIHSGVGLQAGLI